MARGRRRPFLPRRADIEPAEIHALAEPRPRALPRLLGLILAVPRRPNGRLETKIPGWLADFRAPEGIEEQAGSRLAGSGISPSLGSVRTAMSRRQSTDLGSRLQHTSPEHVVKLVYFDDFKLGVLKNDAVVDVSAAVKDIPHTGPGDLMNGLIEHWASYKPRLEAAAARRRSAGVGRTHPPAGAGSAHDRLHGGQLHGRRHAQRAGADQRLPQIAERHHRTWRHHGAAGRAGLRLRGRGGDRGRHRQEVQPCQRSRGHGLRLRLHELHRRFGARPAAAGKRVFPDEKP